MFPIPERPRERIGSGPCRKVQHPAHPALLRPEPAVHNCGNGADVTPQKPLKAIPLT